MDRNLSSQKWKNIFWSTLTTILCIVCFPANPLVFTGVIEVKSYTALTIVGWVVWAFGMVLVMAPIVMFPRRGGVTKGKSFVNTTQLVDTGIYAVVRHPQYTGGIYAIFLSYPFTLSTLAIRGSWGNRYGSALHGLQRRRPAHDREVRR